MTYLVDARSFASRPTGVGQYALGRLAELRREDASARFVLACDVLESEDVRALAAEGMEVHVYGSRVFNSMGVIGYFRFLRRVARTVRPDVVWEPNNLLPFRPPFATRVVVTMHDTFGLGRPSLRYLLWHLYYRVAFRRTLAVATEIWFNSRETERQVRAVAPRAFERLQTFVTYPVVRVPPREAIAPARRARPFFLYLGNIEARKGADLLIVAFRRYRAEGGRADLVFAGIEKNVAVPHEEGFEALGYVSDEEKFSLLVSAVALVVPSRAEGYGMQVAEAAALRCPCLASDLAVFREIDGTGRRVFPLGDLNSLVTELHRLF